MTSKSMRRIPFVAALLLASMIAVQANAQCCPAPTTAFVQPAAVTAFQPVAPVVPVVQTGWYPGFWLDRIRARLWGAPSTFVAASPVVAASPAPFVAARPAFVAARPAVVAAHPTAHHAAFAPTYTAAFRPAHTVAFAAPVAAPVAACPACPAPTVAAFAAPAPACPACPACPPPAVGQVVQQAAPCPTCPTAVAVPGPAAVAVPAPAVAVPGPAMAPAPGTTPAPQRTFDAQNAAPTLDPGTFVPDRPQDAQRQPTDDTQQPIQPEPADDSFNGLNRSNSTYFQAPKLLDPNDRTAQRIAAPVINALYEKPVAYRQVSHGPISRQQAEQDAIGWVSAAN